MRAYDLARISEAGEYTATGRDLDIAIQGRGFFVMNGAVDGAGAPSTAATASFPGRRRAIPGGRKPVTVQQGYLVDKNGYFLQGGRQRQTAA